MRCKVRLIHIQRVEDARPGARADGAPEIKEGFRLRFMHADDAAPAIFGEFERAIFELRTDQRTDLAGLRAGGTYEIEVRPID